MTVRTRFSVAAVIALAVAGTPFLGQPASAETAQAASTTAAAASASAAAVSMRSCPKDYVCLWEHVNYRGTMKQFQDSGKQNLDDFNFRDTASSVVNNTDREFQLVDRRWRKNHFSQVLPPGKSWRDLRHVSPGNDNWNDKADKIFIR